jgi:hypothetical protein
VPLFSPSIIHPLPSLHLQKKVPRLHLLIQGPGYSAMLLLGEQCKKAGDGGALFFLLRLTDRATLFRRFQRFVVVFSADVKIKGIRVLIPCCAPIAIFLRLLSEIKLDLRRLSPRLI